MIPDSTNKLIIEPLRPEHASELFVAHDHAEIWRLRPDGRPASVEVLRQRIEKTCAKPDWQAFIIRIASTREVAGTSGFLHIDAVNRSLEIGATMYAPKWQRTFVNTTCKLALLTEAFEIRKCVRVELRVDTRNERSMAAVERIGATREGTLRRNRVCADGYIRDSAIYSIIESEWPGVKARLVTLLARHA
jgi:RimJ/RimL family protein N-acetyltransferase